MKDTDTVTISVPHKITVERIKDLLCGAIEGGSNYWIATLDRNGGVTHEQAKYRQDVPFVEGGYLTLVEDEEGGSVEHNITRKNIFDGLHVMAEKYPRHFSNFVNEDDDAETSDVFLQCCVFGETVYG